MNSKYAIGALLLTIMNANYAAEQKKSAEQKKAEIAMRIENFDKEIEQRLAAAEQEDPIIELPSAKILSKRLQAEKFDNFMKETNIIEELGDQELRRMDIYLKVLSAMADYVENHANPKSVGSETMMPKLLKIILQDSPGALEKLNKELEDNGLSDF